MAEEIVTIKRLKQAIRTTRNIYVQPRFGTSERWIRVSKKDALELIDGMTDDKKPYDYEMTGDIYGTLEDDGTLSIG